MTYPNYLQVAQRQELINISVNGNAHYGRELLTRLLLGHDLTQVRSLVSKILAVNDSFTYIAMPLDESLQARQVALDYLLTRLPRPAQPQQIINTFVEYSDCLCDDSCADIPAPTGAVVDNVNNHFSFDVVTGYINPVQYEMELSYVVAPPAPTDQLVDDEQNTFSFTLVPGIGSASLYEYEITPTPVI